MHEPSFNHNLLLFFCLLATLSPCSRQILSTLLWFTTQSSLRSIAVILGVPYLPYWATKLMIRLVRTSSSGSFFTWYLWVVLFCPIARQARLWEMPYLSFAAFTAYLRLAGLTSFPPPHPSVWHYLRPGQQQSFLDVNFPFQALLTS